MNETPIQDITQDKIEQIISSQDFQRAAGRVFSSRYGLARTLRLAHRHFTPKAKRRKKDRRKMARASRQYNDKRAKGK